MNKNLWLLYLTIGAELFRVHLLVNYQQTSSAFAVLINFATAKNDDDDDGLIPAIRKKVKCFAETNCTACSQMHDCVWCSNGQLVATIGSSKTVLQEGGMCWTGGFMHVDDSVIAIDVAGIKASIRFECGPWHISSWRCAMNDASILVAAISASLLCCCLAGATAMYTRRRQALGYARA